MWLKVVFGLVVAGIGVAQAQYQPFALLPPTEGSRRQRVEFYGTLGYWHADDVRYDAVTVPDDAGGFLTSDVDFGYDDSAVFGFGVGWTINDHFEVRMEFDYVSADYRAEWGDYWLSGEMWMNNGRINLDYNFVAGPLTPFATVGIGYHYFDTGIPTGPGGYYCWWDYWWGYVCTGYVETYDEFDLALNAGAGLRWDISDHLFMKAQALVNWIDMGNGANWPHQLEITCHFGAKF